MEWGQPSNTHLLKKSRCWLSTFSVEKQVWLTIESVQNKLQKRGIVKVKMRDKKANKPVLTRQSSQHHPNQETSVSSCPFLHFMGKRLQNFIDRLINMPHRRVRVQMKQRKEQEKNKRGCYRGSSIGCEV